MSSVWNFSLSRWRPPWRNVPGGEELGAERLEITQAQAQARNNLEIT